MVGRVGTDVFGDELLRDLKMDGVDVTGVARDPHEPSGAALILVEEGGQNTIAVAPGSNGKVGDAEIRALVAGLERGDVVVMQLEVPHDTVRTAAMASRRAGASVVLNASPFVSSMTSSLPEVDVLVVNEGEADALSGLAVTDAESAEAAAAVLNRFARAVVVTLGAAGSVLWKEGRPKRVAPRRVEAVDATAAGDAFIGALAYGLAKGSPLADAVELGGAAGAVAVTRMGARGSLPTLDEVQRLLGAELS
jgi:ribokinase